MNLYLVGFESFPVGAGISKFNEMDWRVVATDASVDELASTLMHSRRVEGAAARDVRVLWIKPLDMGDAVAFAETTQLKRVRGSALPPDRVG